MVDDVLLAIGGKDNEGCSRMKTCTIYALNELGWHYMGEMSVKAYWVDVAVLPEGDILVVDGCSRTVMKGNSRAVSEFRKQEEALKEEKEIQHTLSHLENQFIEVKKTYQKEKKKFEVIVKSKETEITELKTQIQQLEERCTKYEEDFKCVRSQNRKNTEELEIQLAQERQENIDLLTVMARDRKHSNELFDNEMKSLNQQVANPETKKRLKVLESDKDLLKVIPVG